MTNLQAIDLLKGLEQSLDDYCELNDEGKTAFRMAITALELFGNSEQLPSAQPEERTEERTETHACDCVSRQAAIDAVGGNEPVGDPSKMDDDDVVKMWERIRIINIINKLPSAQPERKTGQWLPTICNSDGMHHEWCGFHCSICKEATVIRHNYCPRCGAKMEEGGQDEQA